MIWCQLVCAHKLTPGRVHTGETGAQPSPAQLHADAPEQSDEADQLDRDPDNGPLDEHEYAVVSSPLHGPAHMPRKKHTVPRHFSLREKK